MAATNNGCCSWPVRVALLVALALIAAANAQTVSLDKTSYQFGETITVTWDGVTPNDAAPPRIGLFVPGDCPAASGTDACIANTPYIQVIDLTTATGSHPFERNAHTAFFGQIVARLWITDATSDLATSATAEVIGSVTVTANSFPLLFYNQSVQLTISSAFHNPGDWVGLFPADLCGAGATPEDCNLGSEVIPPGATTFDWWKEFQPNDLIDTTKEYVFGYVLEGYNTDTSPLKWGQDRIYAKSTPFRFSYSGSIDTGKSVVFMHEPISFTWTTQVDHDEGDCLAVFTKDQPPSQWLAEYVTPQASTGTLALGSIAKPGFYVAYYLQRCNGAYNSSFFEFEVQSGVTISTPASMIVKGGQYALNYTTKGFQTYSDVVGVYTEQCTTADSIINESGSCALLGFAAWIPANSTSGTIVVSHAASAYLQNVNFRLWYLSELYYPIVQFGPVRVADSVGRCAAGCTNQNALCATNTECQGCTATQINPTCVAIVPPTLAGATPEADWEVSVYPSPTLMGRITFKIQALNNNNGALSLYHSGFPESILSSGLFTVTEEAFTNGLGWNVTWQTTDNDQSLYVPFCYAVGNEYGMLSQQRCYYFTTRGRHCRSYGDPHMSTFDENNYDFMGFGDFYLIKSKTFAKDRFSVQVRYDDCSSEASSFSCNRAIAVTDAQSKFAVYLTPSTDGTVTNPKYQYRTDTKTDALVSLTPDAEAVLPNGAKLYYYSGQDQLIITLRNGIYIEVVYANSQFNNLQVKMPSAEWLGAISGLCGEWDNNLSGDFTFPNGTVYSGDDLYSWGETWRVSLNDSAFDYTLTGFSYDQVNRPNSAGTPQWSSEELRIQATDLCTNKLGLTGVDLANCLFDIQASGSISAASAVGASFVQACNQAETITEACMINAACPNRCNFLGTCNAGACGCITGFTGADCSAKSVAIDPPSGAGVATPVVAAPIGPPSSANTVVVYNAASLLLFILIGSSVFFVML